MYAQTFEKIEVSSSEETQSDSSEDEEDLFVKQTHFMNMTTLKEYEKNRDMLFTKDILRKRIVIDSHNYYQPDNFNTSNFTVIFDFECNTVREVSRIFLMRNGRGLLRFVFVTITASARLIFNQGSRKNP